VLLALLTFEGALKDLLATKPDEDEEEGDGDSR